MLSKPVVEIFEVGQGGRAIVIFEKQDFKIFIMSLDCNCATILQGLGEQLFFYALTKDLGLLLLSFAHV